MFTRLFWRQALERAAKSAIQALIGAGVLDAGFDAIRLNWQRLAGIAIGAAVLSVGTSLLSLLKGEPDSPSLVSTGE